MNLRMLIRSPCFHCLSYRSIKSSIFHIMYKAPEAMKNSRIDQNVDTAKKHASQVKPPYSLVYFVNIPFGTDAFVQNRHFERCDRPMRSRFSSTQYGRCDRKQNANFFFDSWLFCIFLAKQKHRCCYTIVQSTMERY